MVTTAQEYNANLHLVNSANPPIFAQLPSAENIYNIDINSREIDPPQFLSVEEDHASETVYFIVDRYADYMDLADTCCMVQYINAKGNHYFYTVPFYDIYTYHKQQKMLIPWVLDRNIAAKEGIVHFSLQFFKIIKEFNVETGKYESKIGYSLNTLPATSKILKGIEQLEFSEQDENMFADWKRELMSEINNIKQYEGVKWTILNK